MSKADSDIGGQCAENLLGVRVGPPDNASGRLGGPYAEIFSKFRSAERRLLVAISSGKRDTGTKNPARGRVFSFLVAGRDFHFSDSTHAHLRQIASDGSQTGRDPTKCLYGLFAAASISASNSTNSGSSRIES